MGIKMPSPLPPIPPRAHPMPRPPRHEANEVPVAAGATAKSGKKIQNWNSRHNLILWMDIAGLGTHEIANNVNMHPSSVSAIKSSELYQTQKTMLMEKLTQSTLSDVIDIIRQDAPKNVKFLIDMRDKVTEHGGDPRVRVAAARQLAHETDRVYPRKTEHHEERVIRISLDAPHLHRLAGALRDIGAPIPVEVIEQLDPLSQDPARPRLEGKSIDQLLTELRPPSNTGDTD